MRMLALTCKCRPAELAKGGGASSCSPGINLICHALSWQAGTLAIHEQAQPLGLPYAFKPCLPDGLQLDGRTQGK